MDAEIRKTDGSRTRAWAGRNPGYVPPDLPPWYRALRLVVVLGFILAALHLVFG